MAHNDNKLGKARFAKLKHVLGSLKKSRIYNLLILWASVFGVPPTPWQVGGFGAIATLWQAKMFRTGKPHRISSLSAIFHQVAT